MHHRPTHDTRLQYQGQTEHITDPAQILSLLRRVRDSHSLLTVTLPDHSGQYISAILDIDPHSGRLILDELNPREGHELLQTAGRLTADCRHRGIALRFECRIAGIGGGDGIALYHVPLPDSITYLQKRAAYRVQVGQGLAIPVYLPVEERLPLQGQLCDLSVGGLGVRLRADPALRKGDIIANCAIELPRGTRIQTAVEVRFVSDDQQNSLLRIGGRFRELSRPQEQRIQRFVAALERELLRKLPRD